MKPEKIVWEESGKFDPSLYRVVYDPALPNGGTSLAGFVKIVRGKDGNIKEVIAEWEDK